MDNNMPVISAKNLNLWYGDFKALKGISLDVGEQEITALIGPSGCGKSTFLKTLPEGEPLPHEHLRQYYLRPQAPRRPQ